MLALFEFFSTDQFKMVFVFAVLGLAILAFFKEWVSPDLVALFGMGLVLLVGILPPEELLKTFSNPAPLTIACMFVLSAGLERSGCIDVMGACFP